MRTRKGADRPPCIRLERSPKSPRSTTRENRDRRERWTYGPREPRLPHHPEDEGWDRDNASPGRRKHSGPREGETGPTRAHPLKPGLGVPLVVSRFTIDQSRGSRLGASGHKTLGIVPPSRSARRFSSALSARAVLPANRDP